MNHGSILLVIHESQDCDTAPAWVQDTLQAWPMLEAGRHAPASTRPKLKVVGHATALQDPGLMRSASMVWLYAERMDEGETFELLGLIVEAHRPGVLSTINQATPQGSAHEDGIINCPVGTRPEEAAAILSAAWALSPIMREMDDEIRLLSAHRGGLSAQVSKLDEELRLAAQLQREFLPREMPELNGVRFKSMWRPAGYVSGDIYDAERLDEHHLGFFLADAVGHGVPAALLTVFIKRSLTTRIIDPTMPQGYRLADPGEALAGVNDALVEHQQGKVRFCTACYGVIDTRTREVCFARAGHPFPFVLRADGQTETLEPSGGLLGVFPEETFETACITLNPGDRFLIYSDGFEMAFPEDESPDGEPARVANERYTRELETLRDGNLDEAMERFLVRLDEQAGSLNQRDDLTVLMLGVDADAPDTVGSIGAETRTQG